MIATSKQEEDILLVGPHTAALREIAVFVDGRTETAQILNFAGALAQEHGARLIGLFIRPDAEISPSETFARGTGILNAIEGHLGQLERVETHHRALFEDVTRRREIGSEWRSLSALSSDVAAHARYADMTVIARSDPGEAVGRSGIVESLVLTSARPIILFPPDGAVSRIRRIVVGWSASREAVRAVVDALPLLVRAEAVEVLVVDHER
jgi:hypothetical protein